MGNKERPVAEAALTTSVVKGVVKAVLIGNPNTGKTSLLNTLTGMRLHVGNWPGKTVEKKAGRVSFRGREIEIVDLPGTYSIAPYSEEEKVSHEYLMTHDPDVIIQTIDVNALERNLLMTMELLALGKNLILAFNFNKEAKRRGIQVDIPKLSAKLQLPIIRIEANTGENIEELLQEILRVADLKKAGNPQKTPDYILSLKKENQALFDDELAHARAIKLIQDKVTPYYKVTRSNRRTDRIDAFVLNKYTAFPLFILVMFLLFKTTFTISTPLIELIDHFFALLGEGISQLGLPTILNSFLIEGIIGGVGSVISFAPLIFILFIFIALLEDSGYLGRTVILMDRIFHRFGISGRSFIPMILGFGCNVPAIMATRTIKARRERLIAIFTNSFMSCGARLPVYLLFAGIFFPQNPGGIVMLLYLAGVLVALIVSSILAKVMKDQEEEALIMELPPYRMPTAGNVLRNAWFHTKSFLRKAGTIIFGSVLIIWVLASFPLGVDYGSEDSLIGLVGKQITPLFRPLGFGHWTFAVALIFGVVAKEVIIGTLGTLHGVGSEALASILPGHLSPLGAISFLFFVLLYLPCLATIAVIRKETNSLKLTLLQLLVSFSIAWIVSFLVYNIGVRLGF